MKMNIMKTNITRIITTATSLALLLGFSACSEQSPFEATNQDQTLNKRPSTALVAESAVTSESGTMNSRYFKKWDEYNGGKIILSQGSQFELLYGSLTPPAELHGKNVTISMTCTQDLLNNELLFEFGPHGSTFEPAATVYFHYTGTNPVLYYIQEDGTYTEQQADQVDTKNQWLILKIHHFSRYALAWSR